MQKVFRLISLCLCAFGALASPSAAPSIARVWDEQILSAIRIDLPNPPAHARNLYHFSVAVYDAWAAYDPAAVGYLFHEKHTAPDLAAARQVAISYAAYRLLTDRYSLSRNPSTTRAALDAQMAALGLNKTNFSLDTSTPVGVGNSVAVAVASYFLQDGARQAYAYQDLPPSSAATPRSIRRWTLAAPVRPWWMPTGGSRCRSPTPSPRTAFPLPPFRSSWGRNGKPCGLSH